ncbi:tRNA uridine-5-carboxymethylaminomethyl(34) synthesis GTPase MnmE [Variovorax sp. OV329]|uniref:tRNA uridine-5-carboxymethylaminomethyl(34) synthesis GTPase MnmE n=1 Tax=Variovorax sp. OV329 TaxID=1882825 RepID=UPI0008DEB902|nr:tRNA uridine-5-carboxymethylaminomethyl(34) synthesis GTPase MnmE [Variovorax sp. OV329]SFM29815.1 tRNA modification GTPase trmE [Variovorax sp. OV329]
MLARNADPIVAIATAPGRGAVGIVRVSGADLSPLVRALCGRSLRPREAHYLPFLDAQGGAVDHGLAIHFPSPNSFTGEDVLELQAHGGPVVLQLLLARCLEAAAEPDPMTGAACVPDLRVAQPGEFSQRAFLNGKMDLAQAEAIADLIDASTEAAARSASRSLSGEFSREIHGLRDALIHLRMLVEATLDFPEEEIDFLQKADAVGQLARLRDMLAAVQRRARQGALLREGIKVVIAGQPNAGKSSLLNALAGAELAIVSSVAGTTRDVVAQTIQIHGVPVHVADTAGLRDSSDEVERIGIERAWGQIESADAILFLHDLTRAHTSDYATGDADIARLLAQKLPAKVPVLHIWNKSDAVPAERLAAHAGDGIALSARNGQGLEALRDRLLELAGWQSVPEGVYLARARHVQALARVGEHLDGAAAHLAMRDQMLDLLAEELRLAQMALNEITGEFGADDLLGVIFSRFCIGK